MTEDIVIRIREEIDSVKVDVQVLRDAADEIERLREERDGWQATAAGLSQDISNAEDEIERLRTLIEAVTRNSLTHLSIELHKEARHT